MVIAVSTLYNIGAPDALQTFTDMIKANIAHGNLRRVVIVGGGFAGLELAFRLRGSNCQVVLIDKNNYHQFPPLIYQVASAGLEPSSIAFPFRRLFQDEKNFYFRMAQVNGVDAERKELLTSIGAIRYDYLVLAAGTTTNYFGNDGLQANTLPMKTVAEAMSLRNTILHNLELAETEDDEAVRSQLLNIVIVGGGPSGVEIAGALAEMKRTVVPHDYPDLDAAKMNIYLLNAGERLLQSFSAESSARTERDLTRLGVRVMQNAMVTGCHNNEVLLADGRRLESRLVVWVSGVRATVPDGIPAASVGRAGRLLTDRYNRVKGLTDVYAIGDQALVQGDEAYPEGHPQLAQVAIQQARTLAANLKALQQDRPLKPFSYRDLGTMATIGRKKAVAEIGRLRFGGTPAWLLWLVVHLRSILGVRNKTVVLLNWMWNYFNYRQSLRLILNRD